MRWHGLSSGDFGLDFLDDILTPMSIVCSKVSLPLMFVNSIQVLFLFLGGLGGFSGAFFLLFGVGDVLLPAQCFCFFLQLWG